MAKSLPLKERALALSRLAGLADRHHEAWWFYFNPEGRGVEVDRYPSLANFETHGHRSLCILHLSAFLCGDHKSTHIGEVLDEMDRLGMEAGLVAEARTAVAKITPKVRKMTIIRGNAVAHRSRVLSHDDAYRKADLKLDDLKEIVSTVRAIGTALAQAFAVQQPDDIAGFAIADLHQLFAPKSQRRDKPDPVASILRGDGKAEVRNGHD